MAMNDNQENKNGSDIPESTSSKPMDSKRDVDQSPDAKTDQDFPGYPHYPAKEDIMNETTGAHRVDADVEKSGTGPNASGVGKRFGNGEAGQQQAGEVPAAAGTDADVTSDDLAALNSTDAEIGIPQNVSNEDINTDNDIPGSELDDANEETGEEDEENNYYSLGGDRHQAQEEDPQSGPNRTDL